MEDMSKHYCQLSQLERDRIDGLLVSNHRPAEIARILKRSKTTICREIERNRRKFKTRFREREGPYEANTAGHKHYCRRKYAKYQGKKIEENKNLKKYITAKLKKHWSPDGISGRMREEKKNGKISFYASKTAIYGWLHSSWGQFYCQYLYSQRYKPKRRAEKKTKKEIIPFRTGIERRSKKIAKNQEYGHFELDTMVSGRKHHSKKSITLVYERKAKYIAARRINSLKPKLNLKAFKNMQHQVREIKTATFDNGLENREHYKLNIDTYFCDPYSAWQKGGVENAAKMIRRYIPKGSDIGNYSHQYISSAVKIINNKPRKSLGYKTPLEVMQENNLLQRNTQKAKINKNPEVALRG